MTDSTHCSPGARNEASEVEGYSRIGFRCGVMVQYMQTLKRSFLTKTFLETNAEQQPQNPKVLSDSCSPGGTERHEKHHLKKQLVHKHSGKSRRLIFEIVLWLWGMAHGFFTGFKWFRKLPPLMPQTGLSQIDVCKQ
eukprot:2554516-Amphidinium_carterae.1